MRVSLVLLVLAAAALALPTFDEFKARYGRVYGDANEEKARQAVFETNMRMAAAKNVLEGDEVFGLSPFADLTPAEFAAQYLMPKHVLANRTVRPAEERKAVIPNVAAVPKSFDWRSQNNSITPVKNQGECGSCWAFSATEIIESVWAIQGNNTLTPLSVQQIVSCDKTDQGCNGGDTPTAYKYVMSAGGLMTEDEYPYKSGGGNTGACKDDKTKNVAKISGFERISTLGHMNETAMMVYIFTKSPLSICVDAESWQTYSGGIVKRACGTQLDHCVMITGYNQDGSVPYWIVRNSWGRNWGEDGYIYVEMFDDLCGIAKEATSVYL